MKRSRRRRGGNAGERSSHVRAVVQDDRDGVSAPDAARVERFAGEFDQFAQSAVRHHAARDGPECGQVRVVLP